MSKSTGPCPVCEHVLSEIALSSRGAGLNEVSDFKVNYVERYDSGARICNDHLGPNSLEASSIGFCDRCLVLFVRVRRWLAKTGTLKSRPGRGYEL
jgi:hypothetical protein